MGKVRWMLGVSAFLAYAYPRWSGMTMIRAMPTFYCCLYSRYNVTVAKLYAPVGGLRARGFHNQTNLGNDNGRMMVGCVIL
jgi:hypothetical protein